MSDFSTFEHLGKIRRYAKKRALLVGINNYENPNNNLNGCVPDAQDMAETLKICGWPRTKIKMLLNEQATTKGILQGLDWLVKDVTDGDVLIFYYSGHGSQTADLNNEEQDRYDEILCPYDIDWRTKKYITDDQLFDYFSNKVPKGVRTDVMLDSCFSGSATRGFGSILATTQLVTGARRQRYLPPPVDHQFQLFSMVPSLTNVNFFGKSVVVPKQSSGNVVNQNNVLWSGCQEYQVSWEMSLGGEIRGAFTYYLTRILRKSNGQIPRGEIYSILRSSMANDGFEQIPNLEVPSEEALEFFPFRKEREVDRPSEVRPKPNV